MSFAIEPQFINTPELAMEYFLVPWDSEAFGFPVAHVQHIALRDGNAEPAFQQFEQWCRENNCRLVSCRMPHDRLRESGFLERHFFRFIEMVYKPRFESLAELADRESALDIREAAAADLPEVEQIARSAFATGRFVLDPQFPAGLGNERYVTWVRNSFADAQHQVIKAIVDGRLAGFFIVEERQDGTAYWHLTAIAPDFQGRGLGQALWQAMMIRHRRAGMHRIETTISAHNTAVINLYAKLGFTFGGAEMTLHRTEALVDV